MKLERNSELSKLPFRPSVRISSPEGSGLLQPSLNVTKDKINKNSYLSSFEALLEKIFHRIENRNFVKKSNQITFWKYL
jgi:hypothetical protein